MSKCPYPDCFLEEHESGDHQLGRPPLPRGSLRCVHEYSHRCGTMRCDFGMQGPWEKGFSSDSFHGAAVGFYVDMLGFGWALCYRCVQQFGAIEIFVGGTDAKTKSHKASRPSPARRPQTPSPAAKSGVVIPFQRGAR